MIATGTLDKCASPLIKEARFKEYFKRRGNGCTNYLMMEKKRGMANYLNISSRTRTLEPVVEIEYWGYRGNTTSLVIPSLFICEKMKRTIILKLSLQETKRELLIAANKAEVSKQITRIKKWQQH